MRPTREVAGLTTLQQFIINGLQTQTWTDKADGHYDANAYLHSPLDYLPGLDDPWFLERIRRNYYVLAIGNQDPLFDQNVKLAHILGSREIPHLLDVWEGFGHDWPWWYKMAEKFFL